VTPRFSVTWDYRCPFARIVHRHIVDALLDGADWDVTFVPFSLGQVHVEDGEPPIWDRPDDDTGLLALQAAVAVRDARRDVFPLVHRALFEARHVDGAHLRDEAVVRDLLTTNGADADAVMAGWPAVGRSPPSATSTRPPPRTSTCGGCPRSSPAVERSSSA
jgi:2-hydroxychromene-2-carboxylate isomerase